MSHRFSKTGADFMTFVGRVFALTTLITGNNLVCAQETGLAQNGVRDGSIGTQSGSAMPVSPAPDLATNAPSRLPPINPRLPGIFMAGDSTAARGSGEAQQ